ncbi:MAG: M20/M25/M40 family metallo-hydrolase [Armatimonadota bacterium]
MTQVDPEQLTDLLHRLVAVNSINPTLAPDGRGEEAIARLIAEECRAAGMDARLDEVVAGRYNVVARISGPRSGRRLMLNGHTDTVGVAGMRDPFGGRADGGRLYGRGAYDMKGSLAAMIEAGRLVARHGLPAGELVLAFVIDEEYESLGTTDLLRRERADAAIVTEPTGLDLCLAHRGFVWARIETLGRAAHGSRYADGDDAIIRMGHVLTALDRLDREELPRRTHPLLGRASIHASTIGGGLGLSTYPDRCLLQVERRTLPGETDDDIAGELHRIAAEAARASPGLMGLVEILLSRPPFEIAPDAPIVRALMESTIAVRGRSPRFVGELPWFDAALLGAAGIPTAMFGPVGAGAHAAEEWVELASVVTCAQVLADVAVRFCEPP